MTICDRAHAVTVKVVIGFTEKAALTAIVVVTSTAALTWAIDPKGTRTTMHGTNRRSSEVSVDLANGKADTQ